MILFGLILWACVSKKSEYERFVSEWQSKEILLPDVMTDVLTGDTIDLADADFSIITYVDSTGCTSCKMKLSLWNVFLDRINQKSDANVKTVIVVNAKDKRDIVHLLKKFKYYHPVYIDADGSMNKINKFPSDPIFQSF